MNMKWRLLFIALILFVLSGQVQAGNWYIHCTNNSCVAEQGALKVYWMATSFDNLYSGKLTGVEGIPVSVEDFSAAEKKVEHAIEKSILRKKELRTSVKADTPESKDGTSAGATDSKENLFAKKRSISQSKTQGKKISVNYTLAFIEWLGDTRFGFDRSIKRYWAAAEYALDAYKRGDIEAAIEQFFVYRNASEIENISVSATIDDDNRTLILTKYVGLSKFAGVPDYQTRYALASDFVYGLMTNSSMAEQADKISEEFRQDIAALKLLLAPRQTAKKLYKKNKDLAFAKWLADGEVFRSHIQELPLEDKYLFAAALVRRINAKDSLDQTDIDFFAQKRAEFENAIKNRDASVKVVTVEGSPFPVIPTIILLGAILAIGAFFFIKRKKNNNRQGVQDEV